jgi:hypothetical protein
LARIDEVDKRYFLMVTPSHEIGYVNDSDISKSCDICGEGKSYGHKHRLHLYIKDTYDKATIRCFNCEYRASLYNYLKDYHPAEFELYRKEKQGGSFQELKMEKLDDSPLDEFSVDDIDTDFMSSEAIPKEPLPNLIDPVEGFTSLPEAALVYIQGRGLEPQENWLYSPEGNKVQFNGNETYLSDYIIVPLTIDRRWYGFQAIGWKQKKFFVYLVDGNDGFKVWNWNNINKEEPVYIFESIYDAMSSGLENVIAQIGTSLHVDRLKQLKDPVFCLDNQRIDEASQRESLKYAENGYKVMIWPEGSEKFKDTNDLRKINVPYEKISKMVKNNIYSSIKAILKLKMI